MPQYAPDLRPERLQELSPRCGQTTDLSHVHRSEGSDRRGFESIVDQVSTDVCDVVQASESDLMARGVAVDLLQMATRVGPQYEAAEYEDLSGEEDLSLDSITIDD